MIPESKVLAGDTPSVKFGLMTWPTGGCESGRGMPLRQCKTFKGQCFNFSTKVDITVRRAGFLLVIINL